MIETDYIKQGDCLELMKELPDGSIDLCVTDPPYLLETQGGGFFSETDSVHRSYGARGCHRFVMKEIDYMKEGISTAILDELCRVMKQVNIYLFCSQKQIPLYINYFANRGRYNWNLLLWHKTDPIPACGNKYLSDTEYILFFREKGVRVYGNYYTKRTHYETTINAADKQLWKHPTIKPLQTIRNFIVNSCMPGDIVLDPFLGSGTTAVAAFKENRHFIGYELMPEYFKTAQRRIDAELRELSLF